MGAAVAPPLARGSDVVLAVEAASICGTDLHLWRWDEWAASRLHPPRVVGHEISGHVVAVGPDADSSLMGRQVAVESHIVCGTCSACLKGMGHVCPNTRILGVDVDGGFCEQLAVPSANIRPVPEGTPPHLAAFLEPMGNAVHSCEPHELAGRVVVIYGCGPIGCAAVGIAVAEGAATVVAVDPNPYRLELAQAMGATHCVEDPQDHAVLQAAGGAPDVVLEMSGAPQAIASALRVVAAGGAVSLLGIGSSVTLDLATDVVMRGVTVFGIVGRRLFGTWERSERYLLQGIIDPTPLFTHHLPLSDIEFAMQLMNEGRCGKISLHPFGD